MHYVGRPFFHVIPTYVTVHAKRVIFAHLTEIAFLISVEILDIAMLNSISGGFISVSVIKLRHLKIDDFEVTKPRKRATSFSYMIPIIIAIT